MRSAASASVGRWISSVRARRSALHLAHHQLAAVGGGGPVHPATVVPGRYGARRAVRRSARTSRGHTPPVSSRPRASGGGDPDGARRAGSGGGRPRRSCATTTAEGSCRGDLEHDPVVHAPALGMRVTAPRRVWNAEGVPVVARWGRRTLRGRAGRGASPQSGAGLATNSSGRPAVESLGTRRPPPWRAPRRPPAPAVPPEDAGEHVTDGLDPARTAVVGYEPPRQEHTGAAHEGDEGTNGRTKRRRRAVLPTGFARSADRSRSRSRCVSSRPRTTATPCSTPSSVRSR